MKRFICAILIFSSIMLCACASSGQEISNDAESTSTVANTTEPPQTESTEPIKPKEYPSGVDFDFSKYRKTMPDTIYTTPASENGLAGKLYQITGTVDRIKKRFGHDDCYIIETEGGDVSVMTGIEEVTTNGFICKRLYEDKFDSYYKMPEIGEYVTIYAEYIGFSDILDLPLFTYGGSEYLATALLNSVRQFEIENEFFASEDRVETFYRLMSSCNYQELKDYIDAFILEGQCPGYDVAYHLSAQLGEIIPLMQNCQIKVDNVEKCARIFYKGVTEITRSTNVLPFVETSDYGASLDITLGFVRSDWLFFDRIYFASDSTETEDFSFSNTITDVLSGGAVYEGDTIGTSAQNALMRICKDSNPIIRFKNSDSEKYIDHELTGEETEALLQLEHIRDLHDEIWDSLSEWEKEWSEYSAFITSP